MTYIYNIYTIYTAGKAGKNKKIKINQQNISQAVVLGNDCAIEPESSSTNG